MPAESAGRIGFVAVVEGVEVALSEEDSVSLGSNLQLLLAFVDEVVPSPIASFPREATADNDRQQLVVVVVVPSSLDSPLPVLLPLERSLPLPLLPLASPSLPRLLEPDPSLPVFVFVREPELEPEIALRTELVAVVVLERSQLDERHLHER